MIILYVVPNPLWLMLGKETHFLILGTLTIMTVEYSAVEKSGVKCGY